MENFSRIVHAATSVTLLGGGFARRDDLDEALETAPLLICADGGANRALAWGMQPAGIIGDLDSVDRAEAERAGVPMQFVDDQNTTDLEKCLSLLAADLVLGVGFLGGRFDHSLSALNALCKHLGRRVILLGVEDVVFRLPSLLVLDLPAETRVSLFPMSEVQATSTGLRWAIDGLPFSPVGQNGCSNVALGGAVHLEVERGHMICMVPRDRLNAVVAALRKA